MLSSVRAIPKSVLGSLSSGVPRVMSETVLRASELITPGRAVRLLQRSAWRITSCRKIC